MASVVIVGASEPTRLLLKGLFRLHRHRVVGEAADLPHAEPLLRGPDIPLLVVDTDLDDGGSSGPVHAFLASHPGLKALAISATRSPRLEAVAHAAGFSSVIYRPFAVHELMETIGRLSPASPLPLPG